MELKVNLLAPATGAHMYARGQVIRPGRNLTVCHGDAYTVTGNDFKHVATLLATMTGIRPH